MESTFSHALGVRLWILRDISLPTMMEMEERRACIGLELDIVHICCGPYMSFYPVCTSLSTSVEWE